MVGDNCYRYDNYYVVAGTKLPNHSANYYCNGESWTCYVNSNVYVDTNPPRVGTC